MQKNGIQSHSDLLIFQSVAQDVVHVLVEALQATITRPHIGVVGGHQTLHCSLQTGQQLPVFLPTKATAGQEGARDRRREIGNEEGG